MFGCLEWMRHVLDQCSVQTTTFNLRNNIPHLPDEIIIDILSCLPVDYVVKFGAVCRNWKALISTPYFASLQLKRATPSVLINYEISFKRKYANVIMLGEKAKDNLIDVRCQNDILLSCDGLLLYKNKHGYFVANPANPASTGRVPISEPSIGGNFIGFYFHPVASEYKLLYVKKDGMFFRYFIYSVTTKIWKEYSLESFPFQPLHHGSPTIINGALHWIVEQNKHIYAGIHSCENGIMIFKMDTEDFFTMPNPLARPHCDGWRPSWTMFLLAKETSLSFCVVDLVWNRLQIWILQDYADRIWECRYWVGLNFGLRRFPYDNRYFGNGNLLIIKPLIIWNDELVLDWEGRGVFLYHLTKNIVQKIPYFKRISWFLHYNYSGPFTKSFVRPC